MGNNFVMSDLASLSLFQPSCPWVRCFRSRYACSLNRYSDDKFSSSFIATVGVDYKSKIESISAADGSKTKVKLQIWDTAGQER